MTVPSLKFFDMSTLVDKIHSTGGLNIMFIGKKHSGKTYGAIDLLYHCQQTFVIGLVISLTEAYNRSFTPHIPARCIKTALNADDIDAFLKCRRTFSAHMSASAKYAEEPHHSLILYDDCLAEKKKWIGCSSFGWMNYNGRHAGVTTIATMQEPIGIPPCFRMNFDFIFIFKDTKPVNIKKIFHHWTGGVGQCEKDFNATFEKYTKNFGCLVIDCTTTSNKLRRQMYHYRATEHEPFQLFYEELWKDNEDYMNFDEVDFSDSDSESDSEAEEFGKPAKEPHKLEPCNHERRPQIHERIPQRHESSDYEQGPPIPSKQERDRSYWEGPRRIERPERFGAALLDQMPGAQYSKPREPIGHEQRELKKDPRYHGAYYT